MANDMEFSAVVDRPVDEVCAVLTNLNNLPQWFSVEAVKDITPGPLHAGTKFTVVGNVLGRDQEIECQVTAYEPCQKLDFEVLGKYSMLVHTRLIPEGAGTRVTLLVDLHISPFLMPLVRGPASSMVMHDLNRFAERMNGGGKDDWHS